MAADSSEEANRTVDARKINGEPFSNIMAALDDLPANGTVRLINSFEPKPLYAVLDRKGFYHETTQEGDDEWHVLISHA